MNHNLERFVDAQKNCYSTALGEISAGRKSSHWIWYIFPQLKGLGRSQNADKYGLIAIDEANAYLQHPILGPRLIEISRALLELKTSDPSLVMGYPDDIKLKSSLTLFAALAGADPIFEKVLQKYYHGSKDARTLQLLERL
jgi:uncharacterized protein (DUF1810 family)